MKIITTIKSKIGNILDTTIKSKISNILDNRLLKQHGYKKLKQLGKGKDGTVFKCSKKNKLFVVKCLSNYGKQYLPLTDFFIKKEIESDFFYNLTIIDESLLVYTFEDLEEIFFKKDQVKFLECLTEICDLQCKLLKNNLVLWDFGFNTGMNYMKNKSNKLKWIDYGGNGFLITNNETVEIKNKRKNLVYANNEFVQLMLSLHIIYWSLGQKEVVKYASEIQHSTESFKQAHNRVEHYRLNSPIETILTTILNAELLTIDGWKKVSKTIKAIIKEGGFHTQEIADIKSIKLNNNVFSVRGYQNYNISLTDIEILDKGHKWASSLKKWNLIESVFKSNKIKTYLDIGSNLGLFVFASKIKHRFKSTGVEYNKEYINICNKINKHYNHNCKFINQSFNEIQGNYDCVTALGIIHHLYQRTEDYGSLDDIIKKFSMITNNILILEFPLTEDPKASKWIKMAGRNSKQDYSHHIFLEIAKKYFTEIKLIGHISKYRPIYVLKK